MLSAFPVVSGMADRCLKGAVVQRIGLYYPYVHFRDEQWLKAAALYWPALARVVPTGFPVADPDVVKALRDELDFVTDVDPAGAAVAVAPGFLKAVEDHGPALRQRFLADTGTRSLHHQNFAELGMGERIVNTEPTAPGVSGHSKLLTGGPSASPLADTIAPHSRTGDLPADVLDP